MRDAFFQNGAADAMKLIHLSDLHLGKRVNEVPMLDDQKFILSQILQITDDERPDCVLIAGDIWDKPLPGADAVAVFDDFLVQLAKRGLAVFLIPGNHDSAERVSFGGRLMEKSGVCPARPYDGTLTPVVLNDSFGSVFFYLLPYIKPIQVRRFFPDETIENTNDAVRAALQQAAPDPNARNVLLAHQFVTGAAVCDSEEVSVGGSDNVDAALFAPFDYTALGHIHNPQQISRPEIRYCGTPLKYSFSEANHEKSVTVVELREKGDVQLHTVPLRPRHDLREIRGSYDEVTAKSFYDRFDREDYLHVTLTDEEDIPDAIGKLRTVYPNLMKLDYDNCRTRSSADFSRSTRAEQKTPVQLLAEFYQQQNGQALQPQQAAFAEELIEKIWNAP